MTEETKTPDTTAPEAPAAEAGSEGAEPSTEAVPGESAPAEAQASAEGEAPRAAARQERKRRRYGGRRKVCLFCADKIEVIDYKDVAMLRRYVSDRGKIEPRRKTGTCARHQRRLTVAIKRARHLALLPFTAEHIRLTGVFPPRP